MNPLDGSHLVQNPGAAWRTVRPSHGETTPTTQTRDALLVQSRLIPIRVMTESGVLDCQREAIVSGIHEVLSLAGVGGRVPIVDLGVWRDPSCSNRGRKKAHASVDWYLKVGRDASIRPSQLECTSILRSFTEEKRNQFGPAYSVLIVRSDMYGGRANYVLGAAIPKVGFVLSVDRFSSMNWSVCSNEALKTTAMHEMGHVFGLVPASRRERVRYCLGKHCTDRCTMRQRLSPKRWHELTADRLEHEPFCDRCIRDLRDYFRTPL